MGCEMMMAMLWVMVTAIITNNSGRRMVMGGNVGGFDHNGGLSSPWREFGKEVLGFWNIFLHNE